MRMKLLEFLMCCAPCSISQILICQPYYVILHRTDGRVTTMRLLDHFSTSLQTNYFFESASFRIVLSSDSSAIRCFDKCFPFPALSVFLLVSYPIPIFLPPAIVGQLTYFNCSYCFTDAFALSD